MEAFKLSTVLSELDEKVLPDGTQKTFSIKFVKKNGELVYYPRCVSTGLNMNLKANAMRGVRLVDRSFDPLDHPSLIRSTYTCEHAHKREKLLIHLCCRLTVKSNQYTFAKACATAEAMATRGRRTK